MDAKGCAGISVSYGAPYKKGRVIFGSLVPYGEVWRTGANEATSITFEKDATFGGKAVKAGTYGLFSIPGEKEWTLILNSDAKQWGAYDYKADKDVLRITVPVHAAATSQEQFTILCDGKNLRLIWDTTQVDVAVQ